MATFVNTPDILTGLYRCPRCKEMKASSRFAGTKHLICNTCQRKLSSPKRLLLMYEERIEKNIERHPEHWGDGKQSKGFIRLNKRMERCKTRISVAYLAQQRGRTVRGKRLANATPAWINENHFREIVADCERANQSTRQKHHLDHIIPLAGKTVSGLHVPWNLQVLEAVANLSKGNRLSPGSLICAYPLGDNSLSAHSANLP